MEGLKSNLKKINTTITDAIKVISPYSKNTSGTISSSKTASNSNSIFSKITDTFKSKLPSLKSNSVIYNDDLENTFPKQSSETLNMSERPSVSKYSVDKSIDALSLDEIKTLLHTVKGSVDNILKTTTLTSAMTLASSKKIKNGISISNMIIIFLILLILLFLCLNIYTFSNYKKNIFSWLSSKIPRKVDDNLEDDESSDESDDSDDSDETENPDIKNNKMDKSSEPKSIDENNDDDSDVIVDENKPKYCYIGNNKNKRSCIKVLNNDECLSKNIFPTMDICINPRLRE